MADMMKQATRCSSKTGTEANGKTWRHVSKQMTMHHGCNFSQIPREDDVTGVVVVVVVVVVVGTAIIKLQFKHLKSLNDELMDNFNRE